MNLTTDVLCGLRARASVHAYIKKGEVVYKGSIELVEENVTFYHDSAQPLCITQTMCPEAL